MRNKLPQLFTLVSKFDRNTLQLAYFAFVLVAFVFTQSPTDGGVGPR